MGKRKPREYFEDEIPMDLRYDDFVALWHLWVDYRAEDKGNPVTQRAARMQLHFLSGMGNPNLAEASIRKSIMSGWTGLFHVKQSSLDEVKSQQVLTPAKTGYTEAPETW